MSSGQALSREYRVLAIRVDFPYEEPDHDTTTGRGAFDLRDYFTDPAVREQYANPWDIPPHDSVYFSRHLEALGNYWSTVSEGRVTVTGRILPDDPRGAYTMSKIFYKYGNGRTTEQTYRKLAELFAEALETCRKTEGTRIRFSDYDTFVVIHAGMGKETSGGLNDIPSAFLNTSDFKTYLGGPLVVDGIEIDNGIIIPEMASDYGLAGLNGILAQMFGHRLGLPSLSNGKDGMPAAGGWSLMDTGGMAYGHMTRGFVPTHPCMWSKIELGWIAPVTVTSDTTLDIAATHVNNGLPRAVRIPITADEYLLIENRERYASRDSLPNVVMSSGDSTGVWMKVDHYDSYIPGSGILVWRINDRIIRENRVAGTINDDPYRRGVDILEADGREDIGAPLGFGDPRSEYSEGHDDDTFKKNGRAALSPSGEPNSGSLWGAASGITVTVNSPAGDVMNVRIAFSPKTDRFRAPSGPGRITASDLDGDGTDELIVSGADSASVVNVSTGQSFTVPANGHPSVVSAGNGTLTAVPRSDGVTFYRYTGSTFEPAARFDGNLGGGKTAIPDGPLASSGDRLLVPTRVTSNGISVGRSLFIVPLSSLPVAGIESIAFNDTSRIVSLAALGDFFAAVCETGSIHMGRISEKSSVTAGLPQGTIRGPVIADLDRNGAYDLVLTAGSKLIIAGDVFPSAASDALSTLWFKSFPLAAEPSGEPVAADIDLDGFPEIIVSFGVQCRAYRANGVLADGFPITLPPGDTAETISSQPLVCDFDGDGGPEAGLTTSDLRFAAFSGQRSSISGFPVSLAGPISDSPAVFARSASGKAALAWRSTGGDVYVRDLPASASVRSSWWPMWRGNATLSGSLPNERIQSPVKQTAPFSAFCYPNPIAGGSGVFRIVPDSATDIRVTVFTADGRKVFEAYLPENMVTPGVPNEIRMDASRFASGLYLAKVTTRSHTETCKVGVLR